MEYLMDKAILKTDDKECSSCGRQLKPDDFISNLGECMDCLDDANYREYKDDRNK
jgi:hypothetical protein